MWPDENIPRHFSDAEVIACLDELARRGVDINFIPTHLTVGDLFRILELYRPN